MYKYTFYNMDNTLNGYMWTKYNKNNEKLALHKCRALIYEEAMTKQEKICYS